MVDVGETLGRTYFQAAVRKGGEQPKPAKEYNPFVDTPNLFLEFARIVERKDSHQALGDWWDKYGLLGLTPRNPRYSEGTLRQGYQDQLLGLPLYRHDDRGGPADDFRYIYLLANEANKALTLYEASLNRDAAKLESLIFGEAGDGGLRDELKRKADASGGEWWVDVLATRALMQTVEYVRALVSVYAYPAIACPDERADGTSEKESPWTEKQLFQSWGARNLAGAMYMQFYWLITSASELSRCKHCKRIISFAPPIPAEWGQDTRKPRSDKEFCDRRCRQNYHYHHRVKPSRLKEGPDLTQGLGFAVSE